MSGKIFINYRRGDQPGFTQALLGRLEQAFPAEQLFIDVDNIPPGEDFVQVMDSQVAKCDVLLAIIGNGWLDAKDERGSRRLDDPHDFVRIEIESALRQGKRVIPVLVHEARMPRPEELPEAIRPLATRNAVRLTHERFRADVQGLVKALQVGLQEVATPGSNAIGAPNQRPETQTLWQLRRRTMLTFGVCAIALAGVVAVWLVIPNMTTPPTAVGVWNWFNGGEVYINSDGTTFHVQNNTQIDAGKWILLKPEGLIRINWNTTGFSDQWQLSVDGRSMTGFNQLGSLPTVYRK
ncbi:MAG: toll/interleukin-1 receptor domain-containing protein [Candidatus Sulfotelmatobacter sp.]